MHLQILWFSTCCFYPVGWLYFRECLLSCYPFALLSFVGVATGAVFHHNDTCLPSFPQVSANNLD